MEPTFGHKWWIVFGCVSFAHRHVPIRSHWFFVGPLHSFARIDCYSLCDRLVMKSDIHMHEIGWFYIYLHFIVVFPSFILFVEREVIIFFHPLLHFLSFVDCLSLNYWLNTELKVWHNQKWMIIQILEEVLKCLRVDLVDFMWNIVVFLRSLCTNNLFL